MGQDREASGQFGGDLDKISRRSLAGPYSPPTNGITTQGACAHLRGGTGKVGWAGRRATDELKRGDVKSCVLPHLVAIVDLGLDHGGHQAMCVIPSLIGGLCRPDALLGRHRAPVQEAARPLATRLQARRARRAASSRGMDERSWGLVIGVSPCIEIMRGRENARVQWTDGTLNALRGLGHGTEPTTCAGSHAREQIADGIWEVRARRYRQLQQRRGSG